MRPFLLALLLTVGSLSVHGQTPSDCQFTVTFTAATVGTSFNNRTSSGATPCVKWRVAYFADGLSAASIQLEGAPDNAGVPGTWAAIAAGSVYEGSNPITDPAQGTAAMTAYYPWIRLNVTVFAPAGGAPHQIIARVYGYKGTSASAATPSPPTGAAGGDLSGAYPDPTVLKVNGGSVPASAHVLGSNGSSQLVPATATDASAIVYAAGGGIAQAQTVALSPAVTALTNGLTVCWLPAAANTGAAPTLAVNANAAKPITKLGATALVANDLTTTAVACAVYDGTEFQLQNPQTSSLPAQAGNAGNFLTTNGTIPSWSGLSVGSVASGGVYLTSTMTGSSNTLWQAVSPDGILWNWISPSALYTAVSPDTWVRDVDTAYIGGKYWSVFNNGTITGAGVHPSFTLVNSPHLYLPFTLVSRASFFSLGATEYVWATKWVCDDTAVNCANPVDATNWHVLAVSGSTNANQVLYEVHPTDVTGLTTWSTPALVTGTGLPTYMVDPQIIVPNMMTAGPCAGQYGLLIVDHANSQIHLFCSASLLSGYTSAIADVAGIHALYGSCEGPYLVQVSSTTWRLYYEHQSDGTWYYKEILGVADWTVAGNWGAQVALTQSDALGMKGGFMRPSRVYDFPRIVDTLTGTIAGLWQTVTTSGSPVTGGTNGVAYFTSANQITASPAALTFYSGGSLSTTQPIHTGFRLDTPYIYFPISVPSACNGSNALALAGTSGVIRASLGDRLTCNVTWAAGAQAGMLSTVTLCNGASTATITINWTGAKGGFLATGGTTSQCQTQQFTYSATDTSWLATGPGSGWY